MGPYDPTQHCVFLIDQLEKGRELAREKGKRIANDMMVSRVITVLSKIAMFKNDIREW